MSRIVNMGMLNGFPNVNIRRKVTVTVRYLQKHGMNFVYITKNYELCISLTVKFWSSIQIAQVTIRHGNLKTELKLYVCPSFISFISPGTQGQMN